MHNVPTVAWQMGKCEYLNAIVRVGQCPVIEVSIIFPAQNEHASDPNCIRQLFWPTGKVISRFLIMCSRQTIFPPVQIQQNTQSKHK